MCSENGAYKGEWARATIAEHKREREVERNLKISNCTLYEKA